jgi:TetR/AcrR family transcriptional regulator, regulator of mycofactocin system
VPKHKAQGPATPDPGTAPAALGGPLIEDTASTDRDVEESVLEQPVTDQTTEERGGERAGPGRRPRTDRRRLERVAVALFIERGFEGTTVGDIAEAAGIGRRTFFRYFGSKNDVVWGEFDEQLVAMRQGFAALPTDAPIMSGICEVVLSANSYDRSGLSDLRQRMTLIASTPALRAHSEIRYDSWRQTVAEYAAGRLGQDVRELVPSVLAGATLGAAVAAYGYWLATDEDLVAVLEASLGHLRSGFGQLEAAVAIPVAFPGRARG